MTDSYIFISLPFITSIVIKSLSKYVEAYSIKASKFIWGQEISKPIIDKATSLSVHVYIHLNFVFSIILSSVTCITVTAMSKVPLLLLVGVVILILIIPNWLMKWQEFSYEKYKSVEGRSMRFWGWFAIFFQWLLAVGSVYYSNTILV